MVLTFVAFVASADNPFFSGGVVTFTPRAIVENPEGVEKLISKLNEHPMWECYILPSVLAMIVDVVKSDNGPDSK